MLFTEAQLAKKLTEHIVGLLITETCVNIRVNKLQ